MSSWSDEDGSYVADIPDLAFCSAFGDTPEEALRQVLIAKEAWLESAKGRGDPIPDTRAALPPRTRRLSRAFP
jgi:predicted RNase H-like HicB family nuclease